ncbi:MAG: DUF885 domain-containing protein [Acidobacteria bacterium]|nr:MAG: DUF885 domain-containing protein [Acidobacteriota bacterium]
MKRALPVLLCLAFTLSLFAQTETEKLYKIFDDDWEWSLRDSPEFATNTGDHRFDDKLHERTAESFERRKAHDRDVLQRIEGVDRAKLSESDRLNYDLFLLRARNSVEGARFPSELMPITARGGVFEELSELALRVPHDTVKDYENFLARIHAYPKAVDDTIALMKRGMAAGLMPAREVSGHIAENIANQLSDDPTKSPIYQTVFAKFPSTISAGDQERLQKAAVDALQKDFFPAIRKLHDYWVDEYYPKTRATIAWTDLPNGKEWYANRVRVMTTTDMTPDQIYELGQSEVKRIRAEMEKVIAQTGFKGSFAEFLTFLRTDPQFFYTTREDLLRGYRDIAKRIDPELMRLFGKLPRTWYGVIPVPAYSEKTTTTAYYQPGSPDVHRPGYMNANLYDLKSRPKWEMEALTLHEAVPGHHLQIALAQEQEQVPRFRRYSGFTAFSEGWGLYAESLGADLGLYTDPYSKFGQLTYEMWRAVRLVVDTGMHTKRWTRQQAIDFFAANSSKPMHDIEQEIDRYISWPAQALAYKIGELKFKELKARAQKALGEKFDIRAFHDQVLGAGPLPMSVLEARTNEWIEKHAHGRTGS